MKKLFKVEKSIEGFKEIFVINIYSKEKELEFLNNETFPEQKEVIAKFLEKFGEEAVTRYKEYLFLRTLLLFILKHKIEENNPEITIGFNYVPALIATDENKINSLIVEDSADLSALEDVKIEDLSKDWSAAIERAVKESQPVAPIEALDGLVRATPKLLNRYLDLAGYPKDPESGDMPIDRGVLNALTIFEESGFSSYNSCQGHERFDTAGVEGAVTPWIAFKMDESNFKMMVKYVNQFKRKYSLRNIDIYPLVNKETEVSGRYDLSFGDRVTLSGLTGASRSNYLQWCLGNLNLFAKEVAGKKFIKLIEKPW